MRAAPSEGLRLVALLVLATLLASAGCSDDVPEAGRGGEASAPPIRIIATTSVIEDWVRNVGGERVDVTALVPAGADVHTLQLAPSVIAALNDAALVVLNGGGLEAGFEAVIEENALAVLRLADRLDLEKFEEGVANHAQHDERDERDPHFWFDVEIAVQAIGAIRDSLEKLDPAGGATYAANARSYIAEILAADTEMRVLLQALPRERRVLVTFHDGFRYFARAYGLEILGFVVEGPEEEPSAEDIARLVEAMRERGSPAIYREPQFSARVVQRVAEETGAEVRELYSLPTGEIDSYLALLWANMRSITR